MPKFHPILKVSEHDEQAEFVADFRREFPEHWIYANANGGKRHPATAVKLKAEGVDPGVPDLHVPSLDLYIEMKTDIGKLSPNQKKWKQYLESQGKTVLVGKGCRSAMGQVLRFMAARNA